ncbi:multidrug ABC transporter permease [Veronia nyctiphanis]|uniref:Multidrug ABC transporter permease n=1 Tax=Veronia nyctiphanis TaxID=1278244 RepID=A0A4Q0YM90_9GAMM|nr:ABC transporter permease [Veronia nyctiphanis]RXJ70449.1 multidrug ABC transporter permease [Veronia nyctiphanis]
MNESGFIQTLAQEWRLIRSDRWLKALLSWLPLVLFAIIWLIFSAGTAREMPVAVIDKDNSQISRTLVRYYDASPTLSVSHYASTKEATDAMNRGEVFATVEIPEQFEKRTLRGEKPDVNAMFNSQYILIGKLVSSALSQAHATLAAKVETKGHMMKGTTVGRQALGESVPIRFQMVPLFNNGTNYAQFLVSAVIPAIWQIVIVAAAVFSLTATDRSIGIERWLQERPLQKVVAKTLSISVPMVVIGVIFASVMHFGLGWPMNGSWEILISAQVLLVLAAVAIGSLIYLAARDPARAMGMTAGFTAPAFAFMGVSFPTSEMPAFAQFWRSMLPVSHYVSVQIGQFNYGATLGQSIPHFQALALFGIAWVLVLLKCRAIRNASLPSTKGVA